MKFYNPFKLHLVEFEDGRYGIRQFTGLHFEYRSKTENWWRMDEYVAKYCAMDTLSEATALLDSLLVKKIKVKQVLHG